MIRQFKERSSMMLFAGELTEQIIKNYLEHHIDPKEDDNFKTVN